MNGSRIKNITRKSKQTFKSHTIIYYIFDFKSHLNPNSIEESTTTIVAAASPPLPAYNARKEKESIGGGFAANVIHFSTKKIYIFLKTKFAQKKIKKYNFFPNNVLPEFSSPRLRLYFVKI